jgi:hypothetical protein
MVNMAAAARQPQTGQMFLSRCWSKGVLCRGAGEKLDLDAERRVRTPEEMVAEAAELAAYFQDAKAASH